MNNQHIFLAPEAIFPIIKDENGNILNKKPATQFGIAGTLQGEGKMVGVPVLFIRTAGCNLRCMWSLPNGEVSLCDTPFASFDTRGETRSTVESVRKTVLQNIGRLNHLVISGGEPFIQAAALTELIKQLKSEQNLHVSVETNGTIFNAGLIEQIDFFSISPKLKNSLPTIEKLSRTKISIPFTPEQAERTRLNLPAIQSIINHCNENRKKDFQLKFVIQNHDELEEIESSFLNNLTGWSPDDIILMPLGSTPEELRQTRMLTLEAAIERGWRYSPRLQINYFNGIAGV
jgi:7-carboxy-7-deazaguanine synthase